MTKSEGKKNNCLQKCSNFIVGGLENFFYKLGVAIGRHPFIVILISLAVLVAFLPGIPLFFYQENRTDKLWVASNSEAIKNKQWVDENFPNKVRFNSYLVTDEDNVLTPTVLKAILSLDEQVKQLNKSDWYDWEIICGRLGSECWSNSLLELWSFNATIINSLTQQEILDTINTVAISPVYGNVFDIGSVLGGIQRDEDGAISAALATTMLYVIQYNFTLQGGNEVDERADDWEQGFLDIGEAGHPNIHALYYYAFRSFGDVGGGAITGDVTNLTVGYFIIIIFVCVVIGRFNFVQQRAYVTLAGIAAIGLSIAVSFGLCSYAGIFYGQLHSILPFLFLGIGVDDMFVIVQAWDNLGPDTRHLTVSERMGLTLKEAGVSITITSLTDVLAFGIGASTILPALESFCIYSCVGILALFFFQSTFFVAALSLNERRAETLRDACCCCCIRYPQDWQPNECSKNTLVKTFFEKHYSRLLVKTPVKVAIVVVAAGLLGMNLYGVVELEQEFDYNWFLPSDSYAAKYVSAQEDYFPESGLSSTVYMGSFDYYGSFSDFMELYGAVESDPYTAQDSLDSWFVEYRMWLNETQDPFVDGMLNYDTFPSSEANFYSLLVYFLYQGGGSRFIKDIQFTSDNRITASRMAFGHIELGDSATEIDAMESIRDSVLSVGFPQYECFPYTFDYIDFETNKVIGQELYRNLGLAFACVFIITLILIANLWTCLLVALCVIMTLIDVLGLMYYWGLTIDTVSSVMAIVAIGLAVDYSAHIGHTFMVETGSRNERTRKTLTNMAPAVFYGGFSTFLAFVPLAGSKSYVFSTFFKVFFGVVIYGLFQGLVFLPVLLSWFGPAPYDLHGGNEDLKEEYDLSTNSINHISQEKTGYVNTHINENADSDKIQTNGLPIYPANGQNGSHISGYDNETFDQSSDQIFRDMTPVSISDNK